MRDSRAKHIGRYVNKKGKFEFWIEPRLDKEGILRKIATIIRESKSKGQMLNRLADLGITPKDYKWIFGKIGDTWYNLPAGFFLIKMSNPNPLGYAECLQVPFELLT